MCITLIWSKATGLAMFFFFLSFFLFHCALERTRTHREREIDGTLAFFLFVLFVDRQANYYIFPEMLIDTWTIDASRSVTGPYLGQVAPVAVLTARERARGVYPGVFGRAVLATLPIGLPRPILLRAADIGPTVKSYCLFPPPLREPNGHATYTGDTRTCVWLLAM